MEITIENKTGLDALLHVRVKEDDYQEEVKKSLLTYQKKMNVPGFRPGKVPFGVVQRMIGKDTKVESVNKLLQKGIQDYLKDNNVRLVLSPLSTYMAEDMDWKANDLHFSYDIGLKPEIQPDIKSIDTLTRQVVEISNEEVETELENLRRDSGKVDMSEEVTGEPGESIALQFRELDEEGNVLEGGQHKMKLYRQDEMPESVKFLVGGKKKGDKMQADIFVLLGEDAIAELFGIDKMTIQDLNKTFELEIFSVFNITPAEADQEFFDKHLGEGKVSSLDEFKTEWKKIVENYYNRQTDNAFFRDVKKALTENTKFELPAEFLKKYFLVSYDAKVESDIKDFDEQLAKFEDELKWILIAEEIAEKQGIKVSDEEVMNYAMALVYNEFSRAGMGNPDEKTVRQYALNYLEQESNYSRTIMILKDNAVFEYLKGVVHPKEEKISKDKISEAVKAS